MSLDNLRKRIVKRITDEATKEIVEMLMDKLDELIKVAKETRDILKDIDKKLGEEK